jgi:sec-independent protein translocase protein TatA
LFGETIGIGELLLILLIVMVIFGAGKLPQIGEGLGKAIANFKKSVSGKDGEKK